MDLGQFGKRMHAKAVKLEPEVARILREVALNVVTEVARDTPRKTGQAQGTWLTSLGGPHSFYIAGEDGTRSWQDSVDYARRVLQNYKGDTAIHITNNVSYIAELNRGTSRKAPALFVQAAVLRAQYKIRSIKINLG